MAIYLAATGDHAITFSGVLKSEFELKPGAPVALDFYTRDYETI